MAINSTSTMDRFHGELRLRTSVLATEFSRSRTLRLFLVGFVKDAVYVPTLAKNLNDLRIVSQLR